MMHVIVGRYGVVNKYLTDALSSAFVSEAQIYQLHERKVWKGVGKEKDNDKYILLLYRLSNVLTVFYLNTRLAVPEVACVVVSSCRCGSEATRDPSRCQAPGGGSGCSPWFQYCSRASMEEWEQGLSLLKSQVLEHITNTNALECSRKIRGCFHLFQSQAGG